MAGTVTISETIGGGLNKIVFDWLSDASGNATATTTKTYNGQLLRVIFDPDASGTQPTDAYDVVVNDSDGYDVLNAQGANLSNAANVYKTNSDGLTCMSSPLSLSVSNAGDSKGGLVILYILQIDLQN